MTYLVVLIVGVVLGFAATRWQVSRAVKKAHTDTLTGVYNRALLDKTLGRLIAAAERDKRHLALLMMDLNKFKQANDQYGHQFGDLVLKSVSDGIVKAVRKSDFIFRYGGDEFIVIMPNTTKVGAKKVAEKIRDNVLAVRLTTPQGKEEYVEISIGIAEYPEHAQQDVDLIKAADKAVYKAKQRKDNIEVAE